MMLNTSSSSPFTSSLSLPLSLHSEVSQQDSQHTTSPTNHNGTLSEAVTSLANGAPHDNNDNPHHADASTTLNGQKNNNDNNYNNHNDNNTDMMDIDSSQAAEKHTKEEGNASTSPQDAKPAQSAATDAADPNNNNASAAKTTTPTKTPAPLLPVLKGTLSYNTTSRRHILRGMWNFEAPASSSQSQRFELNRNLGPDEDPTQLPKDGVFGGTFSLAYPYTNKRGKKKGKTKVIHEKDVNISFKRKDLNDNGGNTDFGDVYDVDGTGTNQFGVFRINGTATRDELEKELQYNVVLTKQYTENKDAAPSSSPKKSKSKNKKRKLNSSGGNDLPSSSTSNKRIDVGIDMPKEEGPLPPPSESYASNVYCLRGKLSRREKVSELDDGPVDSISGMWSSGLDIILSDPKNEKGLCNSFEYELRSTNMNRDSFPLSGRYAGWFNATKEDGSRTKISERDVTLRFRENNQGYYNVEGKGSNMFGKYSISGTLNKDNILTIFRHFQDKPQKKRSSAVGTAPLAGSKSLHGSSAGVDGLEPTMTLDDVDVPDQDSYVPIAPPADGEYGALSRGTLRIKDDIHTCTGKWGVIREHFSHQNKISNFNFGLEAHHIAAAVEEMKKRQPKDNGIYFPVDSAYYKGTFKMKRSATSSQSVVDTQIVLKFRENTEGSYNVYGKGVNVFGVFRLTGTLITNSATSGQVQLYRIYEPQPPQEETAAAPPARNKKGLPLAKNAAPATGSGAAGTTAPSQIEGPAQLVTSATPSATPGVMRRESSRQTKVPSRLEDDDPEAKKTRVMEKCQSILKHLINLDTGSGRYFLEPVDPVAHGIPTYHQVITNPMDLGTVLTKFNDGQIDTPEEFSRLIRLVFDNALKFNVDSTHPVHAAAYKLLTEFNKKYRDVERMTEKKKPTKAELKEKKRLEKEEKKRLEKEKKRKRDDITEVNTAQKCFDALKSSTLEVSKVLDTLSMTGINGQNPLFDAVRMMHDQITNIQTILLHLSKSDDKGIPIITDGSTSSALAPGAGLESTAQKPKKKRKPKTKEKVKVVEPPPEPEPEPEPEPTPVPTVIIPPPEERPLTLTEKQELTESINEMSEDQIVIVIDIIKESANLNADEEEIDVEIDQLDTLTQRKLQNFVNQHKPKPKRKPKGKKAAPPPKHESPVEDDDEEEDGEIEEDEPEPAQKPTNTDQFAFGNDDDSDSDDSGELNQNEKQDVGEEDAPSGGFQLGNNMDDEDDDESMDGGGMAANWSVPKSGDEEDEDDASDQELSSAWAAARNQSVAQKAQEKERQVREEKLMAAAEEAKKKQMADAAARGKKIQEERKQKEAEEARLLEEKKLEDKRREQELRDNAMMATQIEQTVDLDGDRDMMKEFESGNMDYGGGESPASSNFGF